MTTFAQDRAAFESFLDCVQGGAGKDAIAGCLAENVVLIGPLSDEPLTGRAFFRLQIEDTVVNGMDYALLDADGKIAEVTIFWRPLPSAVEMQGHLAHVLGMQPWELRTNAE
jgi:hypothetical protein